MYPARNIRSASETVARIEDRNDFLVKKCHCLIRQKYQLIREVRAKDSAITTHKETIDRLTAENGNLKATIATALGANLKINLENSVLRACAAAAMNPTENKYICNIGGVKVYEAKANLFPMLLTAKSCHEIKAGNIVEDTSTTVSDTNLWPSDKKVLRQSVAKKIPFPNVDDLITTSSCKRTNDRSYSHDVWKVVAANEQSIQVVKAYPKYNHDTFKGPHILVRSEFDFSDASSFKGE